jgi:hypothetical protein
MRILFTCVYDGHTRRQHLYTPLWKLRLNTLFRLAMMTKRLAMTCDTVATEAAVNLNDVQDVSRGPQIDTACVSA